MDGSRLQRQCVVTVGTVEQRSVADPTGSGAYGEYRADSARLGTTVGVNWDATYSEVPILATVGNCIMTLVPGR